jgi:hypothetical protein
MDNRAALSGSDQYVVPCRFYHAQMVLTICAQIDAQTRSTQYSRDSDYFRKTFSASKDDPLVGFFARGHGSSVRSCAVDL